MVNPLEVYEEYGMPKFTQGAYKALSERCSENPEYANELAQTTNDRIRRDFDRLPESAKAFGVCVELHSDMYLHFSYGQGFVIAMRHELDNAGKGERVHLSMN
jgi:hypothetical protein